MNLSKYALRKQERTLHSKRSFMNQINISIVVSRENATITIDFKFLKGGNVDYSLLVG